MLRLRGKYTAEMINGSINKKGCKKFRVQKLPCDTVPEACSASALGPLYALMGNAKAPSEPKAAQAAKVATQATTAIQAQNHIQLPPLGDHQFKSLLKELKDQPFQKGQVVVLSRWVNQYKMTSHKWPRFLNCKDSGATVSRFCNFAGSVSDTEISIWSSMSCGFERNAGRPKNSFRAEPEKRSNDSPVLATHHGDWFTQRIQNQKNIH